MCITCPASTISATRRSSSIASATGAAPRAPAGICSTPAAPSSLACDQSVHRSDARHHAAKTEPIQGFNIRRWSDRGLNYWAVSDLAADELAELGEKFEAAIKSSGAG